MVTGADDSGTLMPISGLSALATRKKLVNFIRQSNISVHDNWYGTVER